MHQLATRERIALTPRAMGSGLSGGAIPLAGSIVLNIMRMNRILEIDEVNHVAVVQPGVITGDLQRAVEAAASSIRPIPRACANPRSAGTSRRTPAARAA